MVDKIYPFQESLHMQMHRLLHPARHLRNYLSVNLRMDGRSKSSYRPAVIHENQFHNAIGSSACRLGHSNVVCGVRAELAKPKMSTPENGFIVPNIDVTMLVHGQFHSDLPDRMSCMLHEVLIDSGCVKLSDLCIASGKLVWALYIDVNCLEMDGSIMDAATLGAVTALKDVQLPIVDYDAATNTILSVKEETVKLKYHEPPVMTTFSAFGKDILVDPLHHEECIARNQFRIAALAPSSLGMISKRGGKPLAQEQLQDAIRVAIKREKEFTKIIRDIKATPTKE